MTDTTTITVKDFISEITEQMNELLRTKPLYDNNTQDVYGLLKSRLNTILETYGIKAIYHFIVAEVKGNPLHIFQYVAKFSEGESVAKLNEKRRVIGIDVEPAVPIPEHALLQDLIDERYIKLIQVQIEELDKRNQHLEQVINTNNIAKGEHQEEILKIKAPKITIQAFISELEQLTSGIKKSSEVSFTKQLEVLLAPAISKFGLSISLKHIYATVNGSKQMILQCHEKQMSYENGEDIYNITYMMMRKEEDDISLYGYIKDVRKDFVQNRIAELEEFDYEDTSFNKKLEKEKDNLKQELEMMKS